MNGDDVASATLSDSEGIIAARRAWGYGMVVTVLSDPGYFNESLD